MAKSAGACARRFLLNLLCVCLSVCAVGRRDFNFLDLNHSNLNTIPQAMFNFMSNADAEVKKCDLSGNSLFNITPKLALNFKVLTNLNISHNFLSSLPMEEIGNLRALERLNISRNFLFEFPNVIFKLPHLTHLYAQHNFISEIDIEQTIESDHLALVDLRYNSLALDVRRMLMKKQITFRLVLNGADADVNADDDDNDF